MTTKGDRPDGRTANQIRAIASERSFLNRADGSARISQNKTVVIAAVYGPKEVKHKNEHMDKAFLEVIVKPTEGIGGVGEREKEYLIRRTVENILLATLHPRSSISIVIQVIHDDGSLLSAAVNCVMLALMDAGINVSGMLSAVTCVVTREQKLILDPDLEEEKDARGSMFFAFNSGGEDIVTSSTKGSFTEETFFMAANASYKAAEKIFRFFRLQFQVETN